jgi:hypothetical protein
MFRALSMAFLLVFALALPGNAQQVLKSTEADPEHVFIHLNLGSLHTAWRSVGANQWEVQDKTRAWVAFPPEGSEIRYCHCGSDGTAIVRRVPRARQSEILEITKQIAWTLYRAPTEGDLPPATALQSADVVLVDALLGPEGLVPSTWPEGVSLVDSDFVGHFNAAVKLRVPLSRLGDVFAVIRRLPMQGASTKF